MQFEEPRVLVVSHNVFSASGNMGKTMMHMLAGIPPDNLAQLYFHQEIPTRKCCLRYFRITDSNVLRSVFTRKAEYRMFKESDIDESVAQSRTDTDQLAKIYQFSRRRTPLIYFLRDAMWRFGKWKTQTLLEWVRAFAPNVIFLAASDYAFPYHIAIYLAGYLGVPVVMWCGDDFYIEPQKSGPMLRRLQCRHLLRLAKKTAERSKSIITISDAMQRDYECLFGFPVQTVRISSEINRDSLPAEQRVGVSYVGNLGVNRTAPLIELGRVLKEAGIPGYETIRVYSGERNPRILQQINEENGLTFCGYLSGECVGSVLTASKFLIFTEAFDRKSISRTKYSLSTKVAESLRSGACILAYGPSEIASIEYLRRHRAARILESANELPEAIRQLCSRHDEYESYVSAAKNLADMFHDSKKDEQCMADVFSKAIRNYQEYED